MTESLSKREKMEVLLGFHRFLAGQPEELAASYLGTSVACPTTHHSAWLMCGLGE